MRRHGGRRPVSILLASQWMAAIVLLLGWGAACSPLVAERRAAEAPQLLPTDSPADFEPRAPQAAPATTASEEEPPATYLPEPAPTRRAEATDSAELPPAIPENRLLTLEWPGRIRVGDADVIRLSLEMDAHGSLTPTVEIAGNQLRSKPVTIPNLYETHNVQAQARVELVGLGYKPSGVTSQTLLPGERVDFFWSVQPEQVGTYRGTVWLSLQFHPKGGGAASERTVAAQVLEIEAVNLLGLGGTPARLIGAVGTAVGSLLGLDDVLSWLRRRRSARLRS